MPQPPNPHFSMDSAYLGGITKLELSPFASPIVLSRLLNVPAGRFNSWLRNRYRMPASKKRQLADILEANAPDPKQIINNLRAEADEQERAYKNKPVTKGLTKTWTDPIAAAPHAHDTGENKPL